MQRTGQAQLQAKTHCVFRRNELLNKLIYLMYGTIDNILKKGRTAPFTRCASKFTAYRTKR